MAGGWYKDGAIQEQIDASVNDAVAAARGNIKKGPSLQYCEHCDAKIPKLRQEAIVGVRLCVACQAEEDKQTQGQSAYNRRASKDSQLR